MVPHTHNNRNALHARTSHYLCRRKEKKGRRQEKKEREGERRREGREGKQKKEVHVHVGRQGQAYILTILFPLCPAPQ